MRTSFCLTASALAALASAQTFTDCNPTTADCPNDPAMPATFETDFRAGKDAVKGWQQTAGALNYGAAGADFTISKKGEAPTIQSEAYLHFGYIEVKMKAAPGNGIISSIVLQSNDLDEVDWEFIGSVNDNVQMNYFGKGNTTTYDRMLEGAVSDIQTMHTYALNWTAEAVTWLIDAQPVRTLKFDEANGGNNFPQTPSNVRIGIWAGGDSENQGTRDWAHGAPDYSQAPFTQTVESIKIINYSPGKEYQWTDKTGSFKSIKVIEPGNSQGADVNSASIASPTNNGSSSSLESRSDTPSSSCTEGKTSTTPAPEPSGSDEPCECGTLTVTMTGSPPSPPATNTPVPSSAPATSKGTAPPAPATSKATTPASASTLSTKPVTTPASTPASAPATTPAASSGTSTTGIKTASGSPPSPTVPSTPTGSVSTPTGNSTAPPPVQQTTNAAATNGIATALFGAVGVVMALAF
ncbi:concanavalin A-like lectin/glucanase [Massarina eburnea CBS 473.64]|uniref:Crh-like protein n=1 Tax=Massarina eburnea CBS 473.64 TaxID=1395130 RepID=A0A6A6RM05_9PLEO|nr:concanavalin A-like lectin/glucanase [Massarina eburnea CBS 473.64]